MSEEFTIVSRKKITNLSAITSYGLSLYTIHKGKIFYLLAQTRDSIAYREFIWNRLAKNEIARYIGYMSDEERERILSYTWQELLMDLLVAPRNNYHYKALDDPYLSAAFESNRDNHKKELSIKNKQENEWIFPKGRPHAYEKEIKTALREFEEETGIKSKYITIHKSHTVEEIYYGMDHKLYRSVYYIGYIDYNDYQKYQSRHTTISALFRNTISHEINYLCWLDYDTALLHLNLSKSKVLTMIDSYLIFKLPRKRISRRHSR